MQGVSDADKKHVQDTWAKAKTAGGGLPAVGLKVFEKFLRDNPAMLPKFSYAAGCHTVDELKAKNMKALQDHAMLVITQIDMAVRGMGDHASTAELTALGARHKNYNVAAADFPLLGNSLKAVLKQVLGGDFTSGVEASWGKVYTGISKIMITAMTS